MNNALYVGLSRQMTLKREMDVIANNHRQQRYGRLQGRIADAARGRAAALEQALDRFGPAREDLLRARRRGVARLHPGRAEADRRHLRPWPQGRWLLPGADRQRQPPDPRRPLQPSTPRGNWWTSAAIRCCPAAASRCASIRTRPCPPSPMTAPSARTASSPARSEPSRSPTAPSWARKAPACSTRAPRRRPPIRRPPSSRACWRIPYVDAIQQMTRMIAVSRAYEQVSNMMDQTSNTSDESIQRLGRVN